MRFIFAFLVLLLVSGINGCDCGNYSLDSESVVESEVPQEMSQQEVSDNPIVSLMGDFQKVPVMTQQIFTKKIAEVYVYPYATYESDIQGMLEMNRENIRHRESILEMIFSESVISQVTPEIKIALQAHLNEFPISSVGMIQTRPSHDYPYGYCNYLAELAEDNNKHREFFIKRLRCYEISLQVDKTTAIE